MPDFFKFPGKALTMDQPLDQTHFWEWARTIPRADVTMTNYLKAVGFVIGTDVLSEEQHAVLRSAELYFHSCEPHMQGEFAFTDLFEPVGLGEIGYYVQGAPGSTGQRWKLCRDGVQIRRILVDSGWVMDTQPHETYFQVVNGNMLWAKYQTLIGSRPVCRLKP